jgi:hypothetical protein
MAMRQYPMIRDKKQLDYNNFFFTIVQYRWQLNCLAPESQNTILNIQREYAYLKPGLKHCVCPFTYHLDRVDSSF